MDIERSLVCKIVSTGQLEDAITKGVRRDLFFDDECREVFDFINAHARRYKTPPSQAALREEYEDFEWSLVQEPLDYLIDRFNVMAKKRLAQDLVLDLAKDIDDPQKIEKIDSIFLEAARNLAVLIPTTEVSKFKAGYERRITEYEQRAKEGKKTGIPFGFPSLDDWTGGIQPHELVTISGFSGLGKSTLSMVIAYNAWVNGYTPLIISLEMEAAQMLRKFDAMSAALDYKKLKQLELPPEQLENWKEKAAEIIGRPAEIPIIDKIRNCTPQDVFAETVRHSPDLVVIDYITLMRSSRAQVRGTSMWQSVTEVTQDLKQNARTLGIPIIAMAQTNRMGGKDGAELDNIGYSISVIQDSDIVIGLFADDEMKERKEMEIRLNKNRDGKIDRFKAVWNHEDMIFRQKDIGDMFKRRQEQQV